MNTTATATEPVSAELLLAVVFGLNDFELAAALQVVTIPPGIPNTGRKIRLAMEGLAKLGLDEVRRIGLEAGKASRRRLMKFELGGPKADVSAELAVLENLFPGERGRNARDVAGILAMDLGSPHGIVSPEEAWL
ncbi:hypothetical protein [Longispora albida]|uniref:hypothetical protein n=1 Tax=Longispora albida TaxID=203523 RepID=UPI00037E7994|nr:hypothetical protein [Longispora albida]